MEEIQRLSALEQGVEDVGLVKTLTRAQITSEIVDIEGPCMADETLSGDHIVADMIDERDCRMADDDKDEPAGASNLDVGHRKS